MDLWYVMAPGIKGIRVLGFRFLGFTGELWLTAET